MNSTNIESYNECLECAAFEKKLKALEQRNAELEAVIDDLKELLLLEDKDLLLKSDDDFKRCSELWKKHFTESKQ